MLVTERLPWARWPVPGQGDDEALIQVSDLQAHLKRRGERIDERALDGLISEIGGRRQVVVDPWSLPRRVFDRLRGRGWRTNDAYAVPSEVLQGDGVERQS
jgi:hypothetical protein